MNTAIDTAEALASRAAFIHALRECADFLEQHQSVKVPVGVTTVFNAFVDSKDELAAHARVTSWEKCYQGDYFFLKKSFGGRVSIEINADRALVCRRVVTGKTIKPAEEVDTVEWVCDDPAVLR